MFLIPSSVGFMVTSPVFSQISLPEPPKAAPPPIPPKKKESESEDDERDEALSDSAKDAKDNKSVKTPIPDRAPELDLPRPLYGFFELSLLGTKALVRGGRSGYYSEPSNHVSAWLRAIPSKDSNKIQLWAGLRAAPFNGYGTQNRTSERFAHTYLGPGIAVGRVLHPDPKSKPPFVNGWLLASGVSAVHRQGTSDAGDQSDDFSSTPWAYSPPGAWAELRLMRMFHGALSTNLIIGSQLAKDKNFVYFGVGLGGWL
jgi:hypothetical protein